MIFLLVVGVSLCLFPRVSAFGYASGEKTNTVDVYVGYFGSTYAYIGTYTEEEMREHCEYGKWTYSSIDNGNYTRYNLAEGVTMTSLMSYLNIATGDIDEIYFLGTDGDYYAGFYNLFGVSHYYYPFLAQNWNQEYPSESNGTVINSLYYEVPAILAFQQSLYRDSGAFDEQKYQNMMDDDECLRIVFGQTIWNEVSTSDSVKWVYEMAIRLKGSPITTSDWDAEMGASQALEGYVQVDSGFPELDELIKSGLRFTSDNPAVVNVDQYGNLQALKAGTARIQIEYMEGDNVMDSQQIVVKVTGNASPDPSNPGDPDGGGLDPDDGLDDDGSGGNSSSGDNSGDNDPDLDPGGDTNDGATGDTGSGEGGSGGSGGNNTGAGGDGGNDGSGNGPVTTDPNSDSGDGSNEGDGSDEGNGSDDGTGSDAGDGSGKGNGSNEGSGSDKEGGVEEGKESGTGDTTTGQSGDAGRISEGMSASQENVPLGTVGENIYGELEDYMEEQFKGMEAVPSTGEITSLTDEVRKYIKELIEQMEEDAEALDTDEIIEMVKEYIDELIEEEAEAEEVLTKEDTSEADEAGEDESAKSVYLSVGNVGGGDSGGGVASSNDSMSTGNTAGGSGGKVLEIEPLPTYYTVILIVAMAAMFVGGGLYRSLRFRRETAER